MLASPPADDPRGQLPTEIAGYLGYEHAPHECEERRAIVAEGQDFPAWLAAMPPAWRTTVDVSEHRLDVGDATLALQVLLPVAYRDPLSGWSLPTIVIPSPYGVEHPLRAENLVNPGTRGRHCVAAFFLARGYAVVHADLRGTGDSSGCVDHGGVREQADGRAIVEWVASQAWSDGTVGMRGFSHDGAAALAMAIDAPAALRAVAAVSPAAWYDQRRPGAIHAERREGFAVGTTVIDAAVRSPGGQSRRAIELLQPDREVCYHADHGRMRGIPLPTDDGTRDAFWSERHIPVHTDRIRSAVLVASGGTDDQTHVGFGNLWRAMERSNVTRMAFVGPWSHQPPTLHFAGDTVRLDQDRTCPKDCAVAWYHIELRWFEHWLRGNDTGVLAEPRLHAWTTAPHSSDPADGPRTASQRAEGGPSLTFGLARGCLTDRGEPGAATYRDVPDLQRGQHHPTGSPCARESTPDVVAGVHGPLRLIYDTPPLDEPLRVAGVPHVEVHAAIDVHDTNFVAALWEISSDGTRELISIGWLDARHRGGLDLPPSDVVPGERTLYRFDLIWAEHVIDEGSRVRLDIASSDATRLNGSPKWPPGIRSDHSMASVTVFEGPRATQVRIPIASSDL